MTDTSFISITNQDVYDLLVKQGKTQDDILKHAQDTNGKIAAAIKEIDNLKILVETKADKKSSLGYWISQHPFKFAAGVVVVISVMSPETREVVFGLAKNLIQ